MLANISASSLGYCVQEILFFHLFNSFTVKVKMFGIKFGGKCNYFSPIKLVSLEKQASLGNHKNYLKDVSQVLLFAECLLVIDRKMLS